MPKARIINALYNYETRRMAGGLAMSQVPKEVMTTKSTKPRDFRLFLNIIPPFQPLSIECSNSRSDYRTLDSQRA